MLPVALITKKLLYLICTYGLTYSSRVQVTSYVIFIPLQYCDDNFTSTTQLHVLISDEEETAKDEQIKPLKGVSHDR